MVQGVSTILVARSFTQRLTNVMDLLPIAPHPDSPILQIFQGLWLLATIQLLSKLPGTIGGSNKASSSQYLTPMADPNLRVCL